MAEKQTYKVLRQMDGDKMYYPGDTRELTEADAKHLVDLGALEPVASKAKKAEEAPLNKAEDAPANKAEQSKVVINNHSNTGLSVEQQADGSVDVRPDAPAKKGRRG